MRYMSVCCGLCLLYSANLLADGCQVRTQTSSNAVPEVASESCYEFSGVPSEAIKWSCSNESKEMLNTHKELVAQCSSGSRARCTAALTQASLANPEASARDTPQARPGVPNDAKVITHYYSAEHLQQARVDCESSGGSWSIRP